MSKIIKQALVAIINQVIYRLPPLPNGWSYSVDTTTDRKGFGRVRIYATVPELKQGASQAATEAREEVVDTLSDKAFDWASQAWPKACVRHPSNKRKVSVDTTVDCEATLWVPLTGYVAATRQTKPKTKVNVVGVDASTGTQQPSDADLEAIESASIDEIM